MKCPMMFGTDAFGNERECIGWDCAWYMRKLRCDYNVGEGCAVVFAVTEFESDWQVYGKDETFRDGELCIDE